MNRSSSIAVLIAVAGIAVSAGLAGCSTADDAAGPPGQSASPAAAPSVTTVAVTGGQADAAGPLTSALTAASQPDGANLKVTVIFTYEVVDGSAPESLPVTELPQAEVGGSAGAPPITIAGQLSRETTDWLAAQGAVNGELEFGITTL